MQHFFSKKDDQEKTPPFINSKKFSSSQQFEYTSKIETVSPLSTQTNVFKRTVEKSNMLQFSSQPIIATAASTDLKNNEHRDSPLCQVCFEGLVEKTRDVPLCYSCRYIYNSMKYSKSFDQNKYICYGINDCVIYHGVRAEGCLKCRISKTEVVIESN